MPASMPLPPDVLATLKQRAADVAAARKQLGRARDRLDSAIYAAVLRRGCQVTAVADAARMSRETVYAATGGRGRE